MKKYKVFDSEAGWYRFCDTLTEAAKETDNHIAETDGDCTIQLRRGMRSQTVREPCR